MSLCCFGFESSGNGTGGGVSGSGTLNYLPKWTPNGTTLGNSQLFDNGTNIGLGTITPSAKFDIIGIDSTSLNYTIIAKNSGLLPSFVVRNDGFVGIGTLSPTGNLHVSADGGSGATLFKVTNTALSVDSINVTQGAISFSANTTTFYSSNNSGDPSVVIRSGASGFVPSLSFYNGGFASTSLAIVGTNIPVIQAVNTSRIQISSNIGINVVPTLDAALYAKGLDSTSSNYTIKADNSASTPLLYVRNDGNIGIGYSNPSFAKVQVENSINDLKASWFSINSNTGTSSGQQIYMDNGIQSFSSGILGVNTTAWNSYGSPKDAFIRYGTADGTTGNINFISPATGLGGAYNFYAYRAVSGGIPTLGIKSSYVSINLNIVSASANLHIKGDDSTSLNYALKMDNSSSSPILYARNDSRIGINIASPSSTLDVNGILTQRGLIKNAAGTTMMDINSGYFLNDDSGILSIEMASRRLIDSSETLSIDWQNRYLNDASALSLSWIDRIMYDNSGTVPSIDWQNRILYNSGNSPLLVWNSANLNATLQIGNAGLSSGDLYQDTAANILANGDLVVGIKS